MLIQQQQRQSWRRALFVMAGPQERDDWMLCRVVKDKQTQQANGQAFVEFANAPAAQAAANASAQAKYAFFLKSLSETGIPAGCD